MKVYTINNIEYYLAKDFVDEPCFEACSKSNSRFIKKRELIEDDDFNYFKMTKEGYEVIRVRSRFAKLMVTKEWVDNYNATCVSPKVENEPPLIDLEKNHMKPFSDDEGNIYPIEVRGQRNYKDCYFLAKDIAECFGIKNLEMDLVRPTNNHYQEGIHYRRFWRTNLDTTTKTSSRKKRLFLTYKGLLNLIFRSTSKKADRFADWVCEIVFTVHMGTAKQKLDLTSELIGIPQENVKQYFDACVANVSGLYLISLGTVGQLRKIFGIPDDYQDDMIVYKYGRSDNIATRYQQHVKSYAKLRVYDIRLVYYCPVDTAMASKAEADLRDRFEEYGMKLDSAEHTEIAIFGKKGKQVKKLFHELYTIHLSTNIALLNKLKEITMEKEMLVKQLVDRNNWYETVMAAEQEKYAALKDAYEAKLESRDLKIMTLMSKIKRRDKTIAKLCE